MQTVRNLIEYVTKKNLEFLRKQNCLKEDSSFLEEKVIRKIMDDKNVRPYKRKILEPVKKKPTPKPVEVNLSLQELQLCQIICEVHSVNFNMLFSRSRRMDLVDARRQLTTFLYTYLCYTYSHTGRLFGKDHSTIIHSLRSHEDLLETNNLYASRFLKFLEQAKQVMPEVFEQAEKSKQTLREYEKARNQRAMSNYKRLLAAK